MTDVTHHGQPQALAAPVVQPRSMLDYLLLPRAIDVVKWVIVPLGFLLGSAAQGLPDGEDVVRAVVVWLSLEVLVYQARYQWNDIRGFDADQSHPGGDRRRLPGPPERRASRFAWSGATASAKVGAAIVLCWTVDAAGLMALLTVGVFGVAVVYETLRARCTGRTDEAPAPITAGVAAIWFAIGGGYALRVVTGLGLAVDLGESTPLLIAAVVTGWAFGVAWTCSRWAVEATSFARLEGGELRWHARREHAREHQLALARWWPRVEPSAGPDLKHWRVTDQRVRWSAPWNVVGVVAAGGSVVCGALLVDPQAPVQALVVGACTGAAAEVAVLAAGPRRVVASVLSLPVLAVVLLAAGVEDPVRASLPWVSFMVTQACYLRQDRASLGQFLRRSPWNSTS